MRNPVKKVPVPELFLFFVIAVLGVIYIRYTWIRFEREKSSQVLQVARSIEAGMSKQELAKLEARPGDSIKPEYKKLKTTLRSIQSVNPRVRFVYIYTERNGKIYFYADSEPETSRDYSPPGQEYTEAETAYKVPIRNGKELVTGPVSDRWGTWISVLIPIKDSTTGKTRAVFGMDFKAEHWDTILLFEVFQSTIIIVLLLLAFLFVFIIKAKNKSLKHDISQRKLAEETLSQGRHRARLQRNAIARIALDEVISFGDLLSSTHRLTEEISSAIEVERASVWLLSEDDTVLKCVSLFEKTENKHSSGAILKKADYPRYFESIKKESRINADDAQNDPRTNEFTQGYLVPLGISSMLDAGITIEGKLIGVVCFEHTGEKRTWYSDEESFASTVASVMAQTLSNNGRKLTEEALRKSEEKYRNIFENVQDVFYQTDLLGIVIEISPSIKYFSQFTRDEIVGYSVDNLYYNPDDRGVLLAEILRNGELRDYELILQTKFGELKYVSINARLIPDADGNPNHIDGAIRDISERKQVELELIKAKERAEESDRLKSAFLANMSHEIRTPMNGILGFAKLLKEPGLTGEDQLDYIRIIEKSGVRMLNIINDIVDISKIESGLMEVDIQETNINEQLDYINNFFKPEVGKKGVQLVYNHRLPSELAIIRTDREKLYAILTNLVKNANKYTNTGSIEFGYEKKDNFLEFFVKDTGIGIPEDRLEAIFERFIQADIFDKQALQGAGLGLSITKAYVEMLGGTIRVKSKPGEGSMFFFTIPYNPVQAKIIPALDSVPGEYKQAEVKNLKILIVEDDETSELYIKKTVRKLSKEIYAARNGIDAVAACRDNPDIDLVLMDISLPGMNGYEATGRIRQFNRDVVIIAQTAFGLAGDREKAMNAGCNDYISKPINSTMLVMLIQKHFNLK